MSITKRIAELEREKTELRVLLDKTAARLAGVDAELKSLRSGAAAPGQLSDMGTTEAVLTVLRTNGGALSPSTILRILTSAGHNLRLNNVTGTLSNLKNEDKVHKVGRGQYLAGGAPPA